EFMRTGETWRRHRGDGIAPKEDPHGLMRTDDVRKLWIIADVARLRAEYALRAAGLDVPRFPPGYDVPAAFYAGLLCPGCGAELAMAISRNGWFCVQCGRGWMPTTSSPMKEEPSP